MAAGRPRLPGTGGSDEMSDVHCDQRDLTVLVVDDEADLREVIRRLLQRQGFTVLATGNAAEALAACREHPGPIDVLLTDLGMPVTPGPELARQAAALRPGLRVVYVSGTSRDNAVAQGLIAGDDAMLQKPFSAHTLTAAVRDAMAGTPA
jgi:CheY-like chemotaxis protein